MKIHIQKTYPYPPNAVWHALTDARAIRQWWVETDFAPVAGHEFFFQDAPQSNWDGRVTGKVLEANAPRKIRFSWNGGGRETEVVYELEPTTDGTRLTLTHSGFKGVSGLFLMTMLRFGWRTFVKKLLPEMAAHLTVHEFSKPFPTPPKAQRVGAGSTAARAS